MSARNGFLWRAVNRALTAALTTVPFASIGACRDARPTTEAVAAASSDPAPVRPNDHVRLDASQLEQIGVEQLSGRAPANAIKATGTVEFNADRMAKLLPPVAGQIQNLTVNVGDTVRRNDVVFVLSSREVAAAIAEHQSSHKDLELAEKTFAMTRDLFEHQAASRMALDQAESELAKARAKVRQTEESLQVLGVDQPEDAASALQPRIPVRTPIDGTVIERNVTNGQFVGPENSPLITIADLANVWVQGDIFERDLRNVATGQKAEVTAAAYPDDRFSAQVSRIASVVDPQTRTAKVRFLVANPGERLKPGMYTSINLFLPDATASLTVPTKAIFVENGRTFAYVQSGPREFARTEVEAVPSGSDRLRILRGVRSGDRVVSDGVLLLRQLEMDSSAR
jgi:cobalt-zinc-cadmium efflux system membrane fusion protein